MKALLEDLKAEPEANGLDDQGNPISILIAEDEEYNRELLVYIFEFVGYKIVGQAKNGREAVELFESTKPDLITMDINMPEVDGIEAIKEIMKINPDAKIMVLSALSYMVLLKDAMEKGARGFITKPIQAGSLRDSLIKLKKVAVA